MTRKNWIYVLQPAECMNVVLSFFTFFLVKPVYKHRQTHTIKELLTKFIRMLCCKRCHVLDSWRTYWKQGNHHDESLKEMWSRLLEAMELWKSSIGSLFFVISSCQCLALPGIKKMFGSSFWWLAMQDAKTVLAEGVLGHKIVPIWTGFDWTWFQ